MIDYSEYEKKPLRSVRIVPVFILGIPVSSVLYSLGSLVFFSQVQLTWLGFVSLPIIIFLSKIGLEEDRKGTPLQYRKMFQKLALKSKVFKNNVIGEGITLGKDDYREV